MDTAVSYLQQYAPYIRKMAKHFAFTCCRGRVSTDDLEQEGFYKVLVLIRAGQADNEYFVERSIRNHMISIVQDNCSALRVTKYGRSAKAEKADNPAKECAMIAMQLVIPYHELTQGDEAQSRLAYEFDDTALFAQDFADALGEKERTILRGLMNGNSQRAISRDTGIPLISVRRACQSMKEKIMRALGPGYEPA